MLATFAERYRVEIRFHLVRASGGKSQPELEKAAAWARRDAEWMAPHFGLSFPATAGTVPSPSTRSWLGEPRPHAMPPRPSPE